MLTAAPKADAFPAAGKAAMTTAAAWPTGVSQLAQAVDACQRCDVTEMCGDWMMRASQAIQTPPVFCPNAAEFVRVKKA